MRVRRCGCSRAAAGPGAGAGPRPPRHAHDPQQHRVLDRRGAGTRGRRCGCSPSLLPDQERVLGRDHPNTLTTRNNIAHWTGEMGDAREALRLFPRVLPDQERVLGRDHPDTLTTRNNIASWTGAVDAEALRLLPSCCRTRSGCWAATTPRPATTSPWTGGWGTREALRLYRAAAGPGAGAGPRPPRHAHDPQQHRVLDRRGG